MEHALADAREGAQRRRPAASRAARSRVQVRAAAELLTNALQYSTPTVLVCRVDEQRTRLFISASLLFSSLRFSELELGFQAARIRALLTWRDLCRCRHSVVCAARLCCAEKHS